MRSTEYDETYILSTTTLHAEKIHSLVSEKEMSKVSYFSYKFAISIREKVNFELKLLEKEVNDNKFLQNK